MLTSNSSTLVFTMSFLSFFFPWGFGVQGWLLATGKNKLGVQLYFIQLFSIAFVQTARGIPGMYI
jgi:hypothetical protein